MDQSQYRNQGAIIESSSSRVWRVVGLDSNSGRLKMEITISLITDS